MTSRLEEWLARFAPRVVGLGAWLALLFAAALVVVLGVQNRGLIRQVRQLRGQQRLPHRGDAVPATRAPALHGDSVTLGGDADRAQVLFIFNTTCQYCLATLPTWREIAARLAAAPGVGLYAVSLDPDSATQAYATAHALRFRMVRFPTPRAAATFRATGVPITLALDSAGTVIYARGGVLTRPAVDSLYAALAVPRDSTAGRKP